MKEILKKLRDDWKDGWVIKLCDKKVWKKVDEGKVEDIEVDRKVKV